MDEDQRLDDLERRLAQVEGELHNLIRAIDGVRAADPSVLARVRVPRETPPLRSGSSGAASVGAAPAASPGAQDAPPEAPTGRRSDSRRDLEAWFGQNALLVVGVLALVATAGFLLKYAFEQGWVEPPLRITAGLVTGLAMAAYGVRARARGLRTFGAAAIGGGAAIAYLAAWAAAGPYNYVSPMVGVGGLAVLSAGVLAAAWHFDDAWLGAMAAAGAYLAPFFLGSTDTSPDLLLAYIALVSAATVPIATIRSWRVTAAIAIAGYFGPALVVSGHADAAWVGVYLAAGGSAGVAACRAANWRGHELAVWGAAWFGLLTTAVPNGDWRGWAYVAGAGLLVVPGWLAVLREDGSEWRFSVSAVLWVVICLLKLPSPASEDPLLVLGLVSAVYILPALWNGVPLSLAVGTGVLAAGILAQWAGVDVVFGWAVLVAAVAFVTRRMPLARVRWAGLVHGGLAFASLVLLAPALRLTNAPAFSDAWAVAWYALTAALVFLATDGWLDEGARFRLEDAIDFKLIAWLMVGALLLVGGTLELGRWFDQQFGRGTTLAELAAGLAISVYWLVFAGGLLAYGFRSDRGAVRVTGLVVASLAIVKVVVYDLATLEALYRVGSFAGLAAIALLGAHAYHRRARPEQA